MSDLAAQAQVFARTLALEASQMIRHATHRQHDIEIKALGDWCSELDRQIENHLRERIA